MVAGFIFILHGVALLIAYFRFKGQGVKEGLLAVAFVVIIFSVGWTISTMLTSLLFTPDFVVRWYYSQTNSYFLQILRKEFNRDTISLVLLTLGELLFYSVYLKTDEQEKKKEEPEKKPEVT
ncbi:MAG: hypothetical protein WBD36_14420 [Bacteroidota bacterium]